MVKLYLSVGKRSAVLIATAILILWALLAPKLQAQTSGTIYGRVTDQTGAAIGGAAVTATHLETGLKRTATTDQEGLYRFTLLPVGKYSVLVEAQGFKPRRETGLELQVQANLRIDVTLELGEITEQVMVTAEVPQVDVASTTLGKVVEERRIVDLPLNGRNFLQLGVLQAGVTPPVPGIDVVGSGTNNIPGGTGFLFSVNGMRITSNNHLLDGVNNVEPITGAAMVVPSPDALQEFRILTNAYSAEFGRAGGSIVTVLTKSGTNSFHGSVYEFLRNDVLDARNFFAPDVPELKQNQFGFTIGGPIIKERTFFFGAYEGFRQRRGIPTSAVVPSLRLRQGDFSQEALKPINPFTRQPFPGDRIPAEFISPVARRVMELWPEPNLGANIWSAAPTSSNDRDQFMVRLDHVFLGGNNTLTGRYIFDDGSLLIPLGHFASNAAPLVQSPKFPNEDANRFQNLMLGDMHIFSQKLTNEFRFSYQRAMVASGKSVDPIDPRSLGFAFPVVSSVAPPPPAVGVSGVTGLGPPILSSRANNFFEFLDTVALTTGKHSVKFGLDIRHTRLATLFTSLAHGAYTFNGLITGNAFADFLIGIPFLFLQAGGKEDKTLRQTTYYFYVQDDYRLTSRLTLNLGLRYEVVPGFTERDNLLLTFVPGKRSVVSPTLPPGLVHSGEAGIPRTLFKTEKDRFAPRVGLAWDPLGDAKTSIRAAYGIFYDESALIQTYNVYQSPDFQPIAVVFVPFSFADPFQGKSPFTPPLKLPVPIDPSIPTTATWIAADLQLPYVQHWNLTLQRQLSPSLAVEVAYVGNKGTKLQGNVDVNQPVVTPDLANLTFLERQLRRPFPRLSGTFEVTSRFNSNYHGLQTTVTQRYSHGLSFQASYTLSKAIDYTTLPTAFFIVPGQNAGRPQDNRNLRAERALSAFDLRHRFVLSYIYELPFFRSSGAASSLLSGWRLSGIVNLQSGYPFTVMDTRDMNFDQILENDRPDLLRNPNLPSDQRRPERWFDTGAFVRPSVPKHGNAGRNIVFSDGIVNFDIGLAKEFKLDEQRRFEFRWEVFNLFNHPNFGMPINDLNSSSFGRVLRTSTAERQMQFALKFIF